LTPVMTAKWSADQKVSTPRKAAKTWEQSSALESWLGSAEEVGSGIASPAHFTGRQEISVRRSSLSCQSSPKRVGRKVLKRPSHLLWISEQIASLAAESSEGLNRQFVGVWRDRFWVSQQRCFLPGFDFLLWSFSGFDFLLWSFLNCLGQSLPNMDFRK
jgi:hypothetical protein